MIRYSTGNEDKRPPTLEEYARKKKSYGDAFARNTLAGLDTKLAIYFGDLKSRFKILSSLCKYNHDDRCRANNKLRCDLSFCPLFRTSRDADPFI